MGGEVSRPLTPEQMGQLRPYMTRADLAWALGIGESTVDEYVQKGVLPPPVALTSGCVRWRWADVDAVLARKSPAAKAAQADPYLAGVDDAEEEKGRRRGRAS